MDVAIEIRVIMDRSVTVYELTSAAERLHESNVDSFAVNGRSNSFQLLKPLKLTLVPFTRLILILLAIDGGDFEILDCFDASV